MKLLSWPSPVVCLLFLLLLTGHSPAAPEAALRFAQDGIEIDAGSLGKFTLEFPALLDASQKTTRKLLEKKLTPGHATLRYDDGTEAELSLGAAGEVHGRFSQVPPEVKNMELNMHIPISFNQGGRWQAGEKSGDFPKEKPASPHLYQGHARTLEITNYEGRTLAVTMPEYAFLQLSDNREWNWAIFHFKSVTPLAPDRKEFTLLLRATGAAAKAAPLVDEFGQSAREEWPGKVKSAAELKADAAAEKAEAAAETLPARDAFGGLPGSQARLGLQATGFFHVEKKDERWWLVDPAGNAFFHLGLCSVGPNEDFTLVKGRESAFAWLPPREGEFATAWKPDSGGTVVSFHLANLIRKYGEPYDAERYAARMIERMRRWGFNSYGAFSGGGEQARQAAQFPAVAHLPLSEWEGVPRLPGIEQVWDPFAEKTRAKVEENFARVLPPRAADPLLIGYFIANEPIYENIPHLVPTLRGSEHACKRRLVELLRTKYQTIAAFNTAWSAQAASFDALEDTILKVETAAAKEDTQAFTALFLDEMFRLVSESFRRHDPHHLLLGSRLMPGTINNEPLCRALGRYVDVMSFNYYTNGVDPALLRRIYGWTGGRPLMLSEFYWSASKESGLAGGREVASQQERGLAYRNYVEQSAALGIVVGIEWFTLEDQAVTGRWFQGFDGERANTGILSVADRPWAAAVAEMKKTNFGIYELLEGKRPPFAWDDPRFRSH